MAGADHVVRRQGNPIMRVVLIGVSVLFLAAILIMPVVSVLAYAFSEGLAVYLEWPAPVLRLQLVERHAAIFGEQGRRHEVHAAAPGPLGRVAVAGAPPDARAQAGRVGLDALQAIR